MSLLRKAMMAASVLALGSAVSAQDMGDSHYTTGMRTMLPVSFNSMFGNEAVAAPGVGCSSCTTACDTGCHHARVGVFGDFLYLRMSNGDIPYAQPVNGLGPQALPTGPLSVVSPGYDTGFRAGFTFTPMELLTIRATYWSWDATSTNVTEVTDGSIFQALTTHPGTENTAIDSLAAGANISHQIRIIDVDGLVKLVDCGPWTLQGVAGVRWAKLNQHFLAGYTILESTTVETKSDFEGIGPRVGLEGEVRVKGGLGFYGKGNVSFLLGDFATSYDQNNIFQGLLASQSFSQNRLVTNLDLELGVTWASCNDRLRISGGYLIQSWSNVISTNGLIDATRQNAFTQNRDNLRDTLIFDGFVVHAELRF